MPVVTVNNGSGPPLKCKYVLYNVVSQFRSESKLMRHVGCFSLRREALRAGANPVPSCTSAHMRATHAIHRINAVTTGSTNGTHADIMFTYRLGGRTILQCIVRLGLRAFLAAPPASPSHKLAIETRSPGSINTCPCGSTASMSLPTHDVRTCATRRQAAG
jgi:hypothetical protein